MPNLSSASKTSISSNRKSVFLCEWWLIVDEGESKLRVGGYVNKEPLGSRGIRLLGSASIGKSDNLNTLENGIQVFGSAAIAKRLDNNTLEAVDGITITISSCMNRSRTLSYGVSAEVCDRFLFGFPCNWEEYAAKLSPERHADTTETLLPMSFDDRPVTRVKDILMSSNTESEASAFTSIIVRDILKETASSAISDEEVSPAEPELDLKQHKEDLQHSKETEDENSGRIQVQADAEILSRPAAYLAETSPKTPVELVDPFSGSVDRKPSSRRIHAEECNTIKKLSGNKRMVTRSQARCTGRRTRSKRDA